MSRAALWTPEDLLVRGVNCDKRSMRICLEELRQIGTASGALLLVVMDRRLIKTLAIATSDPADLGLRLESFVTDQIVGATGLQYPIAEGVPSHCSTFRDVLLKFGISIPTPPSNSLLELEVWTLTQVSPNMPLAASSYVLLFGRRSAHSEASLDQLWSCMRRLNIMVHGSIPIAARRQAVIERACEDNEHRVEAKLVGRSISRRPLHRQGWQDEPYGLFAQAALDVAMTVTQSSYGAFFRLRRDAASLDFRKPIEILRSSSSPDVDEIQRHANLAFKYQQPYMHNPETDRSKSNAVCWLAYPIAFRRFESKYRDVLAVIYLRKSSEGVAGGFSGTDFDALKSITSHLRHHRDWLRLGESTALLTMLARDPQDPAPSLPNEIHHNIALRSEDHAADGSEVDYVLPVEAEAYEPHIADALLGLYQLTRSKSVSLRLLSTNGRYLIRVCRLWGNPKEDDGYLIDIDSRWRTSANAWSAYHGLSCDVPNVHDRSGWRKAHQGLQSILRVKGKEDKLKSLYCAPVRSSGRVMGTVNVESVYPGAYSTTKMLVEAVAAQIGQLLELGRHENERLLCVSSPLGESVHAAAGLNALSEELRRSYSDPRFMKLEYYVRNLVSNVPVSNVLTGKSSERPDLSVAGAIRDTMARLEFSRFELAANSASELVPFLCREDLHGFQVALSEFVDNFRKRADDPSANILSIICSVRFRGGRKWVAVAVGNHFTSRSSEALRISAIKNFGRRPLRLKDRVHWGALRAGATLRRQLGGDIYIGQFDSKYFQVVLEFPMPTSRD